MFGFGVYLATSGVKSGEISFLHNLFLSDPTVNTIFQRARRYRCPNCITIRQMVSKTTGSDSSPPSAAYMRLWIGSALAQIMACRLDGTKPLSEPMLTICQLDPKKYISMKYSSVFIQENAFEHVICEMAAILHRGSWVKDEFRRDILSCKNSQTLVPTWKDLQTRINIKLPAVLLFIDILLV